MTPMTGQATEPLYGDIQSQKPTVATNQIGGGFRVGQTVVTKNPVYKTGLEVYLPKTDLESESPVLKQNVIVWHDQPSLESSNAFVLVPPEKVEIDSKGRWREKDFNDHTLTKMAQKVLTNTQPGFSVIVFHGTNPALEHVSASLLAQQPKESFEKGVILLSCNTDGTTGDHLMDGLKARGIETTILAADGVIGVEYTDYKPTSLRAVLSSAPTNTATSSNTATSNVDQIEGKGWKLKTPYGDIPLTTSFEDTLSKHILRDALPGSVGGGKSPLTVKVRDRDGKIFWIRPNGRGTQDILQAFQDASMLGQAVVDDGRQTVPKGPTDKQIAAETIDVRFKPKPSDNGRQTVPKGPTDKQIAAETIDVPEPSDDAATKAQRSAQSGDSPLVASKGRAIAGGGAIGLALGVGMRLAEEQGYDTTKLSYGAVAVDLVGNYAETVTALPKIGKVGAGAVALATTGAGLGTEYLAKNAGAGAMTAQLSGEVAELATAAAAGGARAGLPGAGAAVLAQGASSVASKAGDIGVSAQIANKNGMGYWEFTKLTVKGMFTDYWYW